MLGKGVARILLRLVPDNLPVRTRLHWRNIQRKRMCERSITMFDQYREHGWKKATRVRLRQSYKANAMAP